MNSVLQEENINLVQIKPSEIETSTKQTTIYTIVTGVCFARIFIANRQKTQRNKIQCDALTLTIISHTGEQIRRQQQTLKSTQTNTQLFI